METAESLRLHDVDHQLISQGRYSVTLSELVVETGRTAEAVCSAMQRLVAKRRVFTPARGLFVFVPSEYRLWGVVPADWFVDPAMDHLDRRYYIGFLSAAEIHGAAHQRPQVTQIIVDRALRSRHIGRVRLHFYVSSIKEKFLFVQRKNTKTGTIEVSSPELTVIDLCDRPLLGGGLDNVATVLKELADDNRLSPAMFEKFVGYAPQYALQRAGYLIELLTDLRLDSVAEALERKGEPTLLDPHGYRRGLVSSRWHLRINASPESEA
jgi:predicted transcriptional regulator of viral defense system